MFGRRMYVWPRVGLGYLCYFGVLGHSQRRGHGALEHDVGSQGFSRLCPERVSFHIIYTNLCSYLH